MVQAYWAVFIVASLVLILTPGQDMVLVVTRSVSRGARAGVATAAGVSTGLVAHTLLATLGLGAVLRASEPLFVALKLVGAAYLLYLGVSMLRARNVDFAAGDTAPRSPRRLFADGAISNVSNPKIAIFYLAFLPQFVAADAARPAATVFVLGLAFAALTFVVKGPMALSAGLLSGWLRSRPQVQRWMHRCSGVVLIALGARLALERRP
jgi:threonine/homoserine/homoserine lactone efflux protein